MGFSIEIIDDRLESGVAVGTIVIGGFREDFEVQLNYWSVAVFRAKWRQALSRLVAGAPAVALMSWMSHPSHPVTRRAWVLFRQDDTVYVQERIFMPPSQNVQFDADEQAICLSPLRTKTEEGLLIAQWETTIGAVEEFLRATVPGPAGPAVGSLPSL